jgi:lysophospholipid acyltransferase (LPLAT)-like uncharacterized protein
MTHRPVVTHFKVRPPTFPQGHWMNRFWGPILRPIATVLCRVPLYRYVLRADAGARAFLATGKPAVFATLHQDSFDTYNGLPRLERNRRFCAMVSYSRDGGLAAFGLRLLGYEVARGSSSHGGGEGLLMLRACLNSGLSAVMVCDGPKAPLGDVKPGTIRLAASAGVPILPVRSWGIARLRFHRSWSKAALSLPMAPVGIFVGAPIEVPAEISDTRPYQLALARSIAALAREASVWAGGPAVAPFVVTDA